MPADIKIRLAKAEDLKIIQDLNHELFLSDAQYQDGYNLNWPYERAGEDYFKGVIAGELGVCFVAEADQEVVGYLAGCLRKPHAAFKTKRAELENMYVKETMRSQGIGGKLAQTFLDWCKSKGAEHVIVGTLAGNDRAVKFYKAHGFDEFEIVLRAKI